VSYCCADSLAKVVGPCRQAWPHGFRTGDFGQGVRLNRLRREARPFAAAEAEGGGMAIGSVKGTGFPAWLLGVVSWARGISGVVIWSVGINGDWRRRRAGAGGVAAPAPALA
jgi:hypothetical protein